MIYEYAPKLGDLLWWAWVLITGAGLPLSAALVGLGMYVRWRCARVVSSLPVIRTFFLDQHGGTPVPAYGVGTRHLLREANWYPVWCLI